VIGGILHRSGDAQMNAVKFDYEKVAARTYRTLEPGEYGVLAPGSIGSSNVASHLYLSSARLDCNLGNNYKALDYGVPKNAHMSSKIEFQRNQFLEKLLISGISYSTHFFGTN
jgi:hypothetical protein